MGLFKSKRDADVIALEQAIKAVSMRIDQLETNQISLRGAVNRKLSKLDGENEHTSVSISEIEKIRSAFGGSLPIEFRELEKSLNQQESS